MERVTSYVWGKRLPATLSSVSTVRCQQTALVHLKSVIPHYSNILNQKTHHCKTRTCLFATHFRVYSTFPCYLAGCPSSDQVSDRLPSSGLCVPSFRFLFRASSISTHVCTQSTPTFYLKLSYRESRTPHFLRFHYFFGPKQTRISVRNLGFLTVGGPRPLGLTIPVLGRCSSDPVRSERNRPSPALCLWVVGPPVWSGSDRYSAAPRGHVSPRWLVCSSQRRFAHIRGVRTSRPPVTGLCPAEYSFPDYSAVPAEAQSRNTRALFYLILFQEHVQLSNCDFGFEDSAPKETS